MVLSVKKEKAVLNDLRDFIEKADELGEVQVVEGADWDVELGALSELKAETPDSPLLLFDKIKGYPPGFRVASNPFASPRRTALGLNLPLEGSKMDHVRAMRRRLKEGIKPLPPVESIDIVRGWWASPGPDVLLSPERRKRRQYEHSLAIITACKPYYWINEFPSPSKVRPELEKELKEKWATLFDGKK